MVGYVGSSKHAFICANVALAEGAWVLWVQDNRFENPTGGRWGTQKSAWRVITASSTETECRRKLQETIERVTNPEFPPKDEKVLYKVTGDTVSFVFYPKDGGPMTANQILRYVCLPDTVDPREHRGK